MNPERFAERMLEIENLTDELEDAVAQRLLDWGLAELGPLLSAIEDAEAAGEKANALYAVMRKINRLIGRMADKAPDELAEDLSALDELCASLYTNLPAPTPEETAASAAGLSGLEPRAALEFILQRQNGHKSADVPPAQDPPPTSNAPATASISTPDADAAPGPDSLPASDVSAPSPIPSPDPDAAPAPDSAPASDDPSSMDSPPTDPNTPPTTDTE